MSEKICGLCLSTTIDTTKWLWFGVKSPIWVCPDCLNRLHEKFSKLQECGL